MKFYIQLWSISLLSTDMIIELEFWELWATVCSLWEKDTARLNLLRIASHFPRRPVIPVSGNSPGQGGGWAVVKGPMLYLILTKLWTWASDTAFSSLGVFLYKMKFTTGLLMNSKLVKHLVQFLAHNKCVLNVSCVNIIVIILVFLLSFSFYGIWLVWYSTNRVYNSRRLSIISLTWLEIKISIFIQQIFTGLLLCVRHLTKTGYCVIWAVGERDTLVGSGRAYLRKWHLSWDLKDEKGPAMQRVEKRRFLGERAVGAKALR